MIFLRTSKNLASIFLTVRSKKAIAGILLTLSLLYAGTLTSLYPFLGDDAASTGFVPVAVAGLLLGFWPGIIMALLSTMTTGFVLSRLGVLGGPLQALIPATMVFIVGFTTGSLRQTVQELNRRTEELSTERRNLQSEINLHILTKQALQESELLFRTVFEHAPIGIVLMDFGDAELRIIKCNPTFCGMYGYHEDEITGRAINILSPASEFVISSVLLRQELQKKELIYEEILQRRKDNSTFPIERVSIIFQAGEHEFVIGISRDITKQKQAEEMLQRLNVTLENRVKARTSELHREVKERRQAEEQAKATLREKEVLLQEVHHRVKNNLQIISSLLALQANNISDPDIVDIFHDSENRVRSMALIHESLYRSDNLAEIDFGEYIRSLTQNLFNSGDAKVRNIHYTISANTIWMEVSQAVPCGLILNELITNVLKHAFPHNQPGQVDIHLAAKEDKVVSLRVQDNGIGFTANFDPETVTSLGLQLVHMLVDQLGGKLKITEDNGSCFEIQFMLTSKVPAEI